jgi:O-antigen ligase
MNRQVLEKWCVQGILGLVLAILVYGPLATGGVRAPDFLVIQALTVGVLVLWGARLWLNPRTQLLWPPICWVVLAFAVYAIARYLTADIEYVARMEVICVLVYAFLFLAILTNLYRQEYIELIVCTLVFLAMGIASYAIYQFATGSDKVWTYVKPAIYAHRGSGTYISPNHLAGFLEMILPLGLAWALVSRARTVLKILLGYASFVILAGIAVSVSRGSWIAVALVLMAFFLILFFHRTYRLPSIVLLVVIAGAGLYSIPRTGLFQSRLKELTSDGRLNDAMRFELWAPAAQLWRENVWWGIGPDHFNYRFRVYRPQTVQLEADRVHNDYLNTLTDWGVVGMALVISALALLWGGVFKTWRFVRGSPNDFSGRKSNKFALVLGASLGMLAILLHSMVDFNMHIPANAILAVTLMALLTSCRRFATDKDWHRARVPVKVVATIILLAGVIGLGWQGTRRATEYVQLERARRAASFSSEQTALLEKAFAVEPGNFETPYAIGEAYRLHSAEGGSDYTELAITAMEWFNRAIQANPYHGYSFMRYGMCLDWVDRPVEALSYFNRAIQLDPNGYFTAAHVGWHYVQTQDYAAAKAWFQRSQRLQRQGNGIADSYLRIVNERLFQNATNQMNPSLLAR